MSRHFTHSHTKKLQGDRVPDEKSQNGSGDQPLAVIGYACRLPGQVIDGPSYWQLLTEGRDAITEVPTDRWSTKAFASRAGIRGKSASRWGGFLDQIDQFEPACFGISPREAHHIDPQQRLLLEMTFEALENAGQATVPLAGSRTGVFVGVSTGDYGQLQRGPAAQWGLSPFTASGCSLSIAANRISYCLDLRGPSFIVDTACSSALVAFDRAVKSLQEKESDLAIVGGVNVIINPETFISFSQASMLSPDGRCKAFDASANGFVRSEGGGVFLLKRLDEAIRDGDPIRGVVLGSGTNQDGRTSGISMPNAEAQEALLKEVYRDSGIDPADVRYVEAHGTGTAVGDPAETQALGRMFGPYRSDSEPLIIGSCKTNLGHLEAASGTASLAKVLLMFEHKRIPPNLHFQTPNPHIPFDRHRLRVPTTLEAWPDDRPAIIGINSFGFGGANAHVILGEYQPESVSQGNGVGLLRLERTPRKAPTNGQDGTNGNGRPKTQEFPVVLTARSGPALQKLAEDWLPFLATAEKTNLSLSEIAFNAAHRRSHFAHRLGFTAANCGEVREQLEAFLNDEARPLMSVGEAPTTPPPVVFVFCGQGPQRHLMGRELYQREPVFRDVMDDIDRMLQPITGWSLCEELMRNETDSQIHLTSIAQPALFAIHVALARLWQSWGIEPAAVVGHSVGEIAAAHVAGFLSLEEAVGIIGHRGQCLQNDAMPGRMIAAALTEDEARTVLAEFEPAACLAAVNSPQMVTLAGETEAIEQLGKRLTERDIWWKALKVRHAFHSHLVEPARESFLKHIGEIENREPLCDMISTVTGQPVERGELGADYWWQNIRRPVRFSDAVQHLRQSGCSTFLEIGPHPVLGASIKQCRRADEPMPAVFASLLRDEPERRTMLAGLAALFTHGVSGDWNALWPNSGQVVNLPRHPWIRERYWHESLDGQQARLRPDYHPLLGHHSVGAQDVWQNVLDLRDHDWLQDHRAGGRILFPASGFMELLLAAAARSLKAEMLTLDDIGIQRGLFLQPDSAPTTQVTADGSGHLLTLASRMNETDESWSEHVRASFRPLPASIAAAPLDIAAWKAKAEAVSVEAFYDTFEQVDLDYGPAFRGVRELHRRGDVALGRIELIGELAEQAGDYLAHPALLDACFQVLLEAMPPEDRHTDRMFLPERIGRVYFHKTPGASAWSEVHLKFGSRMRAVGDIRIYTADGEPAIEIHGFECRAVATPKERDREETNSYLYRTIWHHQPLPDVPATAEPLPSSATVTDIVAKADRTARSTWHDQEPRSMVVSLERCDQVATAYLIEALHQMDLTLKTGEVIDPQQLIESGRLIDRHRTLMERSLDRFVENDQARKENGCWILTADIASPDIAALWREALADFPELYPHLRLIELCGTELAAIFAGEADPLELLFSNEANDLLEQMYRDQPWARYANTFLKRLCDDLVARVPEHRPIRILEIGAGLGGTTAYTLPGLPGHRVEYWFTDVSPFFLSRAEEKFRQYDFVRYQRFDVEQDPAEQGIPPRGFDLVIASDVLHATGNLRSTLERCSELLVEGGMLALRELTQARPAFDLIFGLMEGWWNFQNDPLRSESPLLGRSDWISLLSETGFAEPTTPATCEETDRAATVIVARQPVREEAASGKPQKTDSAPAESNWLIFSDEQGTGLRLADQLRSQGRRCVLAFAGEQFESLSAEEFRIDPASREDLDRLRKEAGLRGNDLGIVHLWSLDATLPDFLPASLERAETLICHSVMHLVQSFADAEQQPQRVLLVTKGARDLSTEANGGIAEALQGALVGFARVVANEHRQMAPRLIDLDPAAEEPDAALWAEIVADDPQAEVAWRGSNRWVPRLEPIPPVEAKPQQDDVPPFELSIARGGDLSSLELREIDIEPPGPGQVQIDVHFVALNFRDVLKALGQYPAENPDQLAPGDECSGIVRAVGEGVTQFQPGDRVVVCSLGCFRSVVTVDAVRVMHAPQHLSLAAAVTTPVVYITVLHALKQVGRLQAGESVLIHSAAGGVGIAALNVARSVNAKIYATAGTDAKRDLLAKFGVERVMNSRTLDFFDELMNHTDSHGVDVVLNSLAGQAMTRSLACLAPHGRFLELGKRDFYENTRIGLYPFRHNVAYHAVDLSAILSDDPAAGTALWKESFGEAGQLAPLPMRIVPVARLQDAFRLMGQGAHIGKIVVDMTQHWGQVRRRQRQAGIRADATYLITGAFGGVGLEVARWLADRGAKHLVMLSRSGPRTDAARQMVETLQGEGVNIHSAACDVTDPQAIERLLHRIQAEMPPLAGVFHLAMVLDDAVTANLNRDRFLKVSRPKAHGAWHLHHLTQHCPLDHFVMFSSASAAVGNFGQANYAAANAALESLAAFRRSQGRPGAAIGWGVLGEVGYVAEREDLGDSLEKLGFSPMSVADVRNTLDATLAAHSLPAERPLTVAVRGDWQKLGQRFRSTQQTPGLIADLIASSAVEEEAADGIRESIAAAEPAAQRELMLNFVRNRVARVLGMSPQKIEEDRPLSEMGLDSLMGVEFASIVEADLGTSLSVSALSRDVTVKKLSRTLLKTLVGQGAEDASAPDTASESQDTQPEILVPLRRGSEGDPLFCFHPAGGELRIYEDLLPELSGEFPIFGLQEGDVPETATIDTLAGRYADAISQEQPTGAVRLLGFSLGGLLAARTAAHLEERGRTVQFLGIIECNAGGMDTPEQKQTRLRDFLIETYELIRLETGILAEMDQDQLAGEAAEVARDLNADAVLNWLVGGQHLADGVSANLVRDYLRRMGADLARMSADAGVPTSRLRVPLFVWSASRGLGGGIENWQEWTSEECRHSVLDAEHFSIMYRPTVEDLASQIHAALTTAANQTTATSSGGSA